jgi:hypothetical protein
MVKYCEINLFYIVIFLSLPNYNKPLILKDMKKTSLLLILLVIAISFSANSQVFTTSYINDSVKIKEATNVQYYNYKIINYDSDGYWSNVSNQFINYNDTLQEIRSVELRNPRDYQIKYGNKFYLLNTAYHTEYDTNFMSYSVKDSITLIYYDIERGEEFLVNINDTLVDLNYRYVFLEQSKEIAIVSSPEIDIMDTNSLNNSNTIKITILDTLGNVLRYNKINRKSHEFSIEEQGNNILISSMYFSTSSNPANIYYIDKTSLELVDSINTLRNYLYLKTINDSIVCGITGLYGIYIDMYNTRNKTITNNYYNVISPSIDWSWNIENFFIDFKNSDSIFFACQLRDNNSSSSIYNSYGIEIFNFKLDGSLNYRYLFNNYQQGNVREIHGVTATNDYGLILDINSRVNDNTSNAWLLKYSPYGNGDSGINDIKPTNQSLVKVYPNPAKDYVNVDIECTNFRSSDIEILDMQGKIVKQAKLKGKQGNRVDVSSLSAGAYTYNVTLNGKTLSGKIIIGK